MPEGTYRLVLMGLDDTDLDQLVEVLERREEEFHLSPVENAEQALECFYQSPVTAVIAHLAPTDPAALAMLTVGISQNPPVRFLLQARRGEPVAHAARRAAMIQHVGRPLDVTQAIRLVMQKLPEDETGVRPYDLLGAVQGGADEAWLRVVRGTGEAGDICVRRGRVVFSECGPMVGDQAAVYISSWGRCSYEYHPLPTDPPTNMDKPIRAVLSEARRSSSSDGPAPIPGTVRMSLPTSHASSLQDLMNPEEPQFTSSPAEAGPATALEEIGSPDAPEWMKQEPRVAAAAHTVEEPEGLSFLDEPSAPDFSAQLPPLAELLPVSEEKRERVNKAFEELDAKSSMVRVAGLISVSQNVLYEKLRKPEAAPWPDAKILSLFGQARELLQSQALGAPSNILLAGTEGLLVFLPLGNSDFVFVAQITGSFSLVARVLSIHADNLRAILVS